MAVQSVSNSTSPQKDICKFCILLFTFTFFFSLSLSSFHHQLRLSCPSFLLAKVLPHQKGKIILHISKVCILVFTNYQLLHHYPGQYGQNNCRPPGAILSQRMVLSTSSILFVFVFVYYLYVISVNVNVITASNCRPPGAILWQRMVSFTPSTTWLGAEEAPTGNFECEIQHPKYQTHQLKYKNNART